jgi:pimeloyl-ACP methyl ester carboxylesterase
MGRFQLRFIRSPAPGVPDHYLHIPTGHTPYTLSRVPVVVMVHGISRNAAEQVLRASQMGLGDMVIVAPLFERRALGRYQQLAAGPTGQSADQALINLLDWLIIDGLNARQINLFGFSGGAQFAHRFALFHPGRVRKLCLAAAGWYTMPDASEAWPAGLSDAPLRPELKKLLAIPTLVFVGRGDNLRTASLNQSPRIDRQQGPHRLARARAWTGAMKTAALRLQIRANIRLRIIPAHRHQFEAYCNEGGMIGQLSEWLEDEPRQMVPHTTLAARHGLDRHYAIAARAPAGCRYDYHRGI